MNFNNIANIDISKIETEESTKMSLILPFLSELEYNVFNVEEVIPEYTCDIKGKKNDKVDYALVKDKKVICVIECKPVFENLDNHVKQLARYFANADVNIAILTNGIEYRFYSDVEKDNIMDFEPFFIFNIKDHKKEDLNYLGKFKKIILIFKGVDLKKFTYLKR